jgi:tetratricopeptide (TPR) repeat protein
MMNRSRQLCSLYAHTLYHIGHRQPYSGCHSPIGVVISVQRQYYSNYINCLMMPKKTIEVTSLPGPEFVDDSGNLIDRAKIVDIFFPVKRRVFGGDAILALEKEGYWKNNLRRELSYVLSPVSGSIIRYLVKCKDYLRVGDPIYEIDTMDNYPTCTEAVTIPPPKVISVTKRKIQYIPLPKEKLREYKLVQNEVNDLQDMIKQLKLDESNDMSKLIYDKLEIYERILMLKWDAYQNTINTLVSPSMSQEEVLQYFRVNDSDPLDVASTHISMGLLYMKLQKYDDALANMAEAVLLRRKKNRHNDFQHFDLLQEALVYLGTIKHKKGSLEGARRNLLEAFKLQTRYLGHTYHPIIANTVHLSGEVYFDLGRYEEALQSYQVALNIYRDIGTNLPKGRLRDFPQPTSVEHEKVTTYEKLKERYKLETAKVLHSMSIVREQLGQRHRALECAIQELRLRNSVLPPDDLSIATCHYMIGDLLVADGGQQKKDPPIHHYRSALSIYEHHYGYQHKTVAMTYITIGALHLLHKKYHDAYESYKKGMEILEQSEGYVVFHFGFESPKL